MFRKKCYLNLTDTDYRVILLSLVRLRNRLIQERRFTDCVDELILKVSSLQVQGRSFNGSKNI